MSIILDIAIVAIIVFNIIYAVKRGFVKMVLKSLTLVVALIAALSLTVPVRDYAMSTDFAPKLETKIHNAVISALDTAEDDRENPPLFSGDMLSSVGLDVNEITEEFNKWKETGKAELKESIAQKCAPLLLKVLCTFGAFLAVFVTVYVCCVIAVMLIDKFTELPVLKQANKLLGVIVGIMLAVSEASVFASLVQMLLPYNSLGGAFANISPENTYIFKLFCNFNIFRMLF